jgi:hypothetical protein
MIAQGEKEGYNIGRKMQEGCSGKKKRICPSFRRKMK